jgi:hypothetical protein
MKLRSGVNPHFLERKLKMKKLHYTNTGELIANIDELVKSMDIIKMSLTLKETEELVEQILRDIQRKLNTDTFNIINDIREQLDATYKPEKE